MVTAARTLVERIDLVARWAAVLEEGDFRPRILELADRFPEERSLEVPFSAIETSDTALADLLLSDELRAGLYAFDLVQKRAKRPAGAPDRALARKVTKVGVVGAGLMAAQIALLFVRRLQVPVVMTDLDQARVDAGLRRYGMDPEGSWEDGRMSPEKQEVVKEILRGLGEDE